MSARVSEIQADRIADSEAFRSIVAERCQPVVLRGLCAAWPIAEAAAQSWDSLQQYLVQLDSGALAQAFIGPPSISGRYYYSEGLDGFNFERRDMRLADALSEMGVSADDPDQPSIYFGSVLADKHVPGFAEQNSLSMLSASVRPLLWLGNASFVSAHYDTFDNLACVVAGRRRFTLYRPADVSRLYVGPIDNTMAGPPVALAVGSEVGDPRYPKFESIRDDAMVAELAPGDAIYLPKLWWHQVEATDTRNMLVNYWWDAFSRGPDAPYSTMMLAMTAIAERPEGERAAWRAFFDHYVFRTEGHPLAHLAEDQRGILGSASENFRRIRAMVMRQLRGD